MVMPAHKPTEERRKQVEQASGLGLPHDQIAALIGISDETLRKYYKTELAVGKAKASAQVAMLPQNYVKLQGAEATRMVPALPSIGGLSGAPLFGTSDLSWLVGPPEVDSTLEPLLNGTRESSPESLPFPVLSVVAV